MEAPFLPNLKLLLLLALFAAPFRCVSAENDDICRFFPHNTIIKDPYSCTQYITCTNFVSKYTKCGTSTPYFDRDTQKCVKTLAEGYECNEEVSCIDAPPDSYIADPLSCKGFYHCQDSESEPVFNDCGSEFHFNEYWQECIYKWQSSCRVKDFDFCSIVKNGVNIKDESSCASYYTCTKGVLTTKTCSKTYYDALTGKCIQKSQVNCPKHPLPKDVCGTEKKPKSNVFVSDGATCRGYYFCAQQSVGADPSPRWSPCPEDTFFDTKTTSCIDPLLVACAEDRCDGRTKSFVLAADKGCRHYLRCKDGRTVEKLSCGNLFFDEKAGACVNSVLTFAACK